MASRDRLAEGVCFAWGKKESFGFSITKKKSALAISKAIRRLEKGEGKSEVSRFFLAFGVVAC